MKKQALAVLMAAAMVASMTACGGSSDKAADSSAATEDKADSADSADSSAATGDGEAVELVVGGVTSSSAKDAVTYFGETVSYTHLGHEISMISLSGTWHSLFLCDQDMKPVTPVYLWSYTGAAEVCKDCLLYTSSHL